MIDFGILINLILFIFFLSTGYESDHNFSGGFMIFLSGWILLALSLQATFLELFHPVYVIPLLSPFAVYLVWRGAHKMFYEDKQVVK